jgi:hypothetical protein
MIAALTAATAVRNPSEPSLANGNIGVILTFAIKPFPLVHSGQQLHIFTVFSGAGIVRRPVSIRFCVAGSTPLLFCGKR